MKECGIYKITSPKKKIYIGQSVNIKKRFNSYTRLYESEKQKKLYNSLRKYGPDKHKFEVIHRCLPEELNSLESYYIDLFQSHKSEYGLNTLHGGNQFNLGIKHTDATIAKMKKRGMPKTALPASNKVTSIKIHQLTMDGIFIKEFPSTASAARYFNCSTANISNCLKGFNKSAKGFKWKWANINKKIKPQKAKEKSIECLVKANSKLTEQFDLQGNFIKEWQSISVASVTLKINRITISRDFHNKTTKSGFIWKRKTT